MKEPPIFDGGMDGNTVHSFLFAVDTYFSMIGIINEHTRHNFTNLLLIEHAKNWYDTRSYTSNATWGTLKSGFLSLFKAVDYDRLNHEALD